MYYADGDDFDVVGWDEDEHVLGQRPRGARGGYGRSASPRGGAARGGAMTRTPAGLHLPRTPGAAMLHPSGPMGLLMPPGTPHPPWFQSALGVSPPMELMNTLPLTPETNGGIFTSAVSTIKFSARPQRPFRGERPVAVVKRSAGVLPGTSLQAQPIFVGVIPQAVEIGATDLDEWAPTAFGVRLAMTDAAQGTLVSVVVSTVGSAIPPGEQIVCNITIYGRALA